MKNLLLSLIIFILGGASSLAGLWLFQDSYLSYQAQVLVSEEKLFDLQQARIKLDKAQALIEAHKAAIKARQTERVAKRVTAATSATLVPYLDTATVPVIILGMEASDYCEQQRDLQAVLDVFDDTQTPFEIEQCLLELQEEMKTSVRDSAKDVEAVVDEFMDEMKEKGRQALDNFLDTYFPR